MATKPVLLRNRRESYKSTVHGQGIPLEQSKRLDPSRVSVNVSLPKRESGPDQSNWNRPVGDKGLWTCERHSPEFLWVTGGSINDQKWRI